MTFAGIRASYAAYETALEMVTRSTLRWFDTNPTGRIVSRLSKDVEQLDDRLSYQWNLLLTYVRLARPTDFLQQRAFRFRNCRFGYLYLSIPWLHLHPIVDNLCGS